MKVMNRDRTKVNKFAWPGGYPIMYIARDGWREADGRLVVNNHDRNENICCAECAVDVNRWPDLIIIGKYIHFEGSDEYCEYCNGFTESAYGNPDEEKSI